MRPMSFDEVEPRGWELLTALMDQELAGMFVGLFEWLRAVLPLPNAPATPPIVSR